VRKQSRKNRGTRSAQRSSLITVLIAVAILAVGAVTVVSRQSLSNKQPTIRPTTQPTKTTVQNLNGAVGQDHTLSSMQRDRDALAGGLKDMIDQSTEGLAEVHHSDGSVSVNLEDRFQSVTVARDDNGRLSQSCVDNPQAAGAFFNIDSKLIEKKPRAMVSPTTKE